MNDSLAMCFVERY